MKQGRLLAAATTAGLVGGSLFLSIPAAGAAQDTAPANKGQAKTVTLTADLEELNFSGASGTATAVVRNQKIRSIMLEATGLAPDAAHAVHIHYGDQAKNECPTMADATNTRTDGTPRLNVADGVPSYGGIAVSLTTTGDTSPASGLALDRMPVSTDGVLSFSRSDIEFTDVAGIGTAKQIADAIRDGEGVVVVHGNDYNANGEYDLDAAGVSELAAVPAEATDPTLCGVLHEQH
jgi:hypothetical protein